MSPHPRAAAAFFATVALAAVAAAGNDGGPPSCDAASVTGALAASWGWVKAHPRGWPDTGEKVGNFALHTWALTLFARHPDAAVRAAAAARASAGLRAPLGGDPRTLGARIAGKKACDAPTFYSSIHLHFFSV